MTARAALGVGAALLLAGSACGSPSPDAMLSKHLIAPAVLQREPWGLRLKKEASVGRDYGVPSKAELGGGPSGSPPSTLPLARAKAVVTRQWVRGSGSMTGVLPEGIFTITDTAAQFRSANDARAFAASLLDRPGFGGRQTVPGIVGASYTMGPFGSAVTGGAAAGSEEIVIVERGNYVYAIAVVGGGSRPSSADAQAVAALQASAGS